MYKEKTENISCTYYTSSLHFVLITLPKDYTNYRLSSSLQLYIISRLTEPCIRVRSGDRLGVYFEESPGAISYRFNDQTPNAFAHTRENHTDPYGTREVVRFDSLVFPYDFSAAAHIDSFLDYYNDTDPDADYVPCPPELKIPDYNTSVVLTTTPEPITGAPGATGPPGPRGPTGRQGPAGQMGATGPQGPQGEMGEPGVNGTAGATGPTGEVGATGMTGPDGPEGATGPRGERGDQGPRGLPGEIFYVNNDTESGATGATGPRGEQGPRGLPGVRGPPGEVYWANVTGPDSGRLEEGDSIFNSASMGLGYLIWLIILTVAVIALTIIIIILCLVYRRKKISRESQTDEEGFAMKGDNDSWKKNNLDDPDVVVVDSGHVAYPYGAGKDNKNALDAKWTDDVRSKTEGNSRDKVNKSFDLDPKYTDDVRGKTEGDDRDKITLATSGLSDSAVNLAFEDESNGDKNGKVNGAAYTNGADDHKIATSNDSLPGYEGLPKKDDAESGKNSVDDPAKRESVPGFTFSHNSQGGVLSGGVDIETGDPAKKKRGSGEWVGDLRDQGEAIYQNDTLERKPENRESVPEFGFQHGTQGTEIPKKEADGIMDEDNPSKRLSTPWMNDMKDQTEATYSHDTIEKDPSKRESVPGFTFSVPEDNKDDTPVPSMTEEEKKELAKWLEAAKKDGEEQDKKKKKRKPKRVGVRSLYPDEVSSELSSLSNFSMDGANSGPSSRASPVPHDDVQDETVDNV